MTAMKRTSRWMVYIGILIIGIIVTVMFGPMSMSEKPEDVQSQEVLAPADDPSVDRILMYLDGYPNATHAFIYAAEINGYFREQGLLLDIRIPTALDDPLSSVGTGEAELALVPGPQLLFARAKPLPIISVGAVIRRPLTYLTVAHDSAIHSPRHLAGKKIGYAHDLYFEAVVRTMLADEDIDFSEVTFTDIGRSFTTVFNERQADAVIGPNVHRDRLVLRKREVAIRTIEPMLYGVPAYYESVIAANEQDVAEHADLYAKIWKALSQGQRYVAEHPELAIQIIMSRQSSEDPLDPAIERESLDMLIPFMDAGEQPFGYQSEEVWLDTEEWLADLGMLGEGLDSGDVFVNLAE